MLKIAAMGALGALGILGASHALTSLDAKLRGPELRPASDTPDGIPTVSDTREDAPRPSGGPAQVSRSADGHYWAEGQVNGRRVRFLVDTGASAVALTMADADRLGIRPDRSEFIHRMATANGETLVALVKLDSVQVAGARVEDVDALVVDKGLNQSLLGMTYLGRLSRFEATPSALILRP